MNRWTELRTAYQVAKLGTVSAAANALGFHRATVNRHIDLLEEEIGERIFIRHARGYALTELGEEVLRVAQKAEELIGDLAGRVRGGKSRIEGEIKLTTLPAFAPLLLKAIAEFRGENPQCRVDIDASEDLAKLEYGEAHVALRAGRKPDHPDYVVSSFGRVGFGLYGHKDYLESYGVPDDENDLDGHQFVVPPDNVERLPFRAWITKHVKPEQVAVSSRHVWVNIEAVLSGLGLGFMGDFEAAARHDLHCVLAPQKAWHVPLWLVTHVDLHRTEKVQAMLRQIKASKPDFK